MYGKRDGRAGEERSAVAEDRESGAGAGRLFGRLLSPTVTTVTRRALAIVPKAAGSRGELDEVCDVGLCVRLGRNNIAFSFL